MFYLDIYLSETELETACVISFSIMDMWIRSHSSQFTVHRHSHIRSKQNVSSSPSNTEDRAEKEKIKALTASRMDYAGSPLKAPESQRGLGDAAGKHIKEVLGEKK